MMKYIISPLIFQISGFTTKASYSRCYWSQWPSLKRYLHRILHPDTV
eukprot:Gb_30085 [translate_table: standard]